MSLEYNLMAISTKDNNIKKESSLGNMLKGTGLFIGIFIVIYIIILFATWVLQNKVSLPIFLEIVLLNHNYSYLTFLGKNINHSKM